MDWSVRRRPVRPSAIRGHREGPSCLLNQLEPGPTLPPTRASIPIALAHAVDDQSWTPAAAAAAAWPAFRLPPASGQR
ncbi:hypothetical protein CABS01_03185 [Colletotrichum abscissum]|uniref:Uncharacterized protein n=1 Tax=Colletotrichum abscissum TaxID=1671311 RepID=A0A9P9X094_9PEZI|nr:uncharacterized protein CABS01_03185 [Colletotrichum abscissum]KAI3529428.1 hypothetical protein CABS02_14825 [Colletotrichum abscissum]KAK1477883.1 hypothetical protein CABS01_03185 [Colletotrichum abscissum]